MPPDEPPDPALARAAYLRLPQDSALPWVPATLDVPATAAEWRWGIRTGQRIVVLALDVVRERQHDPAPGVAEALLDARRSLEEAFATLEEAATRFSSSERIRETIRALANPSGTAATLERLERLMPGFRCEVFDALRHAIRSLHATLAAIDDARLPTLFGGSTWGEDTFRAFLERALAIEVLRRAFSSDRQIQPAQPLVFAQLTPSTPSLIFTAAPFRDLGPRTALDKLTGMRLGHFAGFYRRSWRVNDFMWGRLDGAARIVDLLVSPERARQLAAEGRSPVARLVAALVPEADDAAARDLRWLVEEALDDAAASPGLPAEVSAAAGAADPLDERLHAVLGADLGPAGDGSVTRALCARAAQYEVLRQELGPLVAETIGDGELGCFTRPLRLDTRDSLQAAIADLRLLPRLPDRLGRDSRDESTSTLAMRTISHAALVCVAALPTLGLPLARVFAPARLPFLAIAGATATGVLRRVAMWVAFAAAATYLAARYLSVRDGEVALRAVRLPEVLLTWIAIVTVASLAVLPAWRARRSERVKRKLGQGVAALLLAAAGAGFAVGYALSTRGAAQGLTAEPGWDPPSWLAWTALAIALPGAVALRHVPVPGLLRAWILGRMSRPLWLAAAVIAVSGVLLWYSIDQLLHVRLGDGWRLAVAVLPAVAAAVAAAYVLRGVPRRAWHLLRGRL